jgi:uncharacterized protein YkwD
MPENPATRRSRSRTASQLRKRSAKLIVLPTPRVVRRRRAIKAGFALLILSLLAMLIARVWWMWRTPVTPEHVSGLTEQESAIIGSVNAERVRQGQSPLKFSARLAVTARGHSYDMAMRHYLAHNSPDGITPAERIGGVGIAYQIAGENIYLDESADPADMPRRAILKWLQSPEHGANLVSAEFTETGVGVARSATGGTYVTQDFVH